MISNSGQKVFLLKIKFKMKIKILSFKFNNLSKHLKIYKFIHFLAFILRTVKLKRKQQQNDENFYCAHN